MINFDAVKKTLGGVPYEEATTSVVSDEVQRKPPWRRSGRSFVREVVLLLLRLRLLLLLGGEIDGELGEDEVLREGDDDVRHGKAKKLLLLLLLLLRLRLRRNRQRESLFIEEYLHFFYIFISLTPEFSLILKHTLPPSKY